MPRDPAADPGQDLGVEPPFDLSLPVPLAVTTSDRNDRRLADRARRAAEEVLVPFVERTHQIPLAAMLQSARALIVFEATAVCLVDRLGSVRFSPGLAHLRIKQLDAGVNEDSLQKQLGPCEGDRVLDCTLGLAADAQVAARLVGPRGSVTALEKSTPLFLLARHGLAGLPRHPRSAPIEVLHADAHRYLAAAAPRSVDWVLYDPMFERKRKSSTAFEALRRHADYAPLTRPTLLEARRVARKAVILKGARYSSDFKKLGVEPEPARPNATVLWAKVPAD